MLSMKILRNVFGLFASRFDALKVFIVSFAKGAIFHPFSTTLNGANVRLGRRATVKKGFFDARYGEICFGEGVWISYAVELSAVGQISLGASTTLQRNVTVNGEVLIGCECLIAPNVFISSSSHVHDMYPGLSIREQERLLSREDFLRIYNKKVIIGDDVWIGANAVIMPGVTIGSHSIIGANSVVTKNVAQGEIVAGVPARVISHRYGYEVD